jgi:hypothetical protein
LAFLLVRFREPGAMAAPCSQNPILYLTKSTLLYPSIKDKVKAGIIAYKKEPPLPCCSLKSSTGGHRILPAYKPSANGCFLLYSW